MRSPDASWIDVMRDGGDRPSAENGRSRLSSAANGPGLGSRDLTEFVQSLDALWGVARRRGLVRLTSPDSRSAIVAVAVAARHCGLRPEQFLWLVKESWAAQPEVRTAADPIATREILSRIITVCIHEFYRE